MFKRRLIERADIGKSYSTNVSNAIDKKKVERVKFYLKVFFIVGIIGTILVLDTLWGGQLDFNLN